MLGFDDIIESLQEIAQVAGAVGEDAIKANLENEIPPLRHLQAELERLRAWKTEALQVLGEWEQVWEAAGRPGRLGESKAKAVARLFNERGD